MNNTFKNVTAKDLQADKLTYLPITHNKLVDLNIDVMTDYLAVYFRKQNNFSNRLALDNQAQLIINPVQRQHNTYGEIIIKEVREQKSLRNWATAILESYYAQLTKLLKAQKHMTNKQLADFLKQNPRQALFTQADYTLWIASQLLTIKANEIDTTYLEPTRVELFARKGLLCLTGRKQIELGLQHQLIAYLHKAMIELKPAKPQLATSALINLVCQETKTNELTKTDWQKVSDLKNWLS